MEADLGEWQAGSCIRLFRSRRHEASKWGCHRRLFREIFGTEHKHVFLADQGCGFENRFLFDFFFKMRNNLGMYKSLFVQKSTHFFWIFAQPC